ncbi:MAG: hypothetical protein U0359_32440 [Byssovorax sp.]
MAHVETLRPGFPSPPPSSKRSRPALLVATFQRLAAPEGFDLAFAAFRRERDEAERIRALRSVPPPAPKDCPAVEQMVALARSYPPTVVSVRRTLPPMVAPPIAA